MKNIEKYLSEILSVGESPCTKIYQIRTGNIMCSNIDCDDCEKLNKKWLEEEYKKPKTDWDSVPFGTYVYCWDIEDENKVKGRLVEYKKESVFPFLVYLGDTRVRIFTHAELVEE